VRETGTPDGSIGLEECSPGVPEHNDGGYGHINRNLGGMGGGKRIGVVVRLRGVTINMKKDTKERM